MLPTSDLDGFITQYLHASDIAESLPVRALRGRLLKRLLMGTILVVLCFACLQQAAETRSTQPSFMFLRPARARFVRVSQTGFQPYPPADLSCTRPPNSDPTVVTVQVHYDPAKASRAAISKLGALAAESVARDTNTLFHHSMYSTPSRYRRLLATESRAVLLSSSQTSSRN